SMPSMIPIVSQLPKERVTVSSPASEIPRWMVTLPLPHDRWAAYPSPSAASTSTPASNGPRAAVAGSPDRSPPAGTCSGRDSTNVTRPGSHVAAVLVVLHQPGQLGAQLLGGLGPGQHHLTAGQPQRHRGGSPGHRPTAAQHPGTHRGAHLADRVDAGHRQLLAPLPQGGGGQPHRAQPPAAVHPQRGRQGEDPADEQPPPQVPRPRGPDLHQRAQRGEQRPPAQGPPAAAALGIPDSFAHRSPVNQSVLARCHRNTAASTPITSTTACTLNTAPVPSTITRWHSATTDRAIRAQCCWRNSSAPKPK